MSWILYFIYLLLLVWVILKWHFFDSPGIEKKWLVVLFLAKIAGGFALFVIYRYYYPSADGDIFHYFNDGLVIHNVLFQSPSDYLKIMTGIGASSPDLMQYYDTCNFWLKRFDYGLPNDNHIVIRANALMCLVSMGNFHIHNMFFGFMSFVGLWAIFKSYVKQLAQKRTLLLIAVFCFPSVWLWTSGVLKESILIFAFGLFIYNFRALLDKPSAGNVIGVIVCLFLLMQSKFYVLMAALPGLAAMAWIRYRPKRAFVKFLVAHIAIFIAAWLSQFVTQVDLFDVICCKQHDFIMMVQSVQAGSTIELPVLDNGLKSIIVNVPHAFVTSLLRPTIFEHGSATMMMAGVENLLILCVLAAGIFFIKLRNLAIPDVWYCLSFIVILFVLIGLTTPVLGALVRYKVPALPFVGILLLTAANGERLQPIDKWIAAKLK
ncbi:MAG: hypothetical protein J6T98_12805 [Salinivirgaceae bacterium]|nr:hypothetical protein [Salinivirgaceae bacterium]